MSVVILDAANGFWGGGAGIVVQGWVLAGTVMAMVSRSQRDPHEAGRRQADARSTPGAGRGRARSGSPIVTGILLGIGIAGFIDESVFHQLLQWHNFYWATDPHGRIVSDGLFHVVSTLVLLWGTLRLWFDAAQPGRALLAGILMGAGGFNGYDGIVQHVLLHLHLVNEHVCAIPDSVANSIGTCPADIPYEIVWITVALLVFLAGFLLRRRTR